MIIKSYYKTTQAQIEARRWNPYLGISINNRAFTCEYLHSYMKWAACRANTRFAVVIVDIIQHINNQVFDRSKPLSAIEKAFRKADEIRLLCEQAKSKLSTEEANRLVILEWTDLVVDECFAHNLKIFREEYANNEKFKNAIVSITKNNLGTIVKRLNDIELEMLGQYLVNELPELATGFNYDGIHYNLNVYPGNIASIYAELLKMDFFHRILSKIRMIGEIASVEAYSQD